MFRQKWTQAWFCVLLLTVSSITPVQAMASSLAATANVEAEQSENLNLALQQVENLNLAVQQDENLKLAARSKNSSKTKKTPAKTKNNANQNKLNKNHTSQSKNASSLQTPASQSTVAVSADAAVLMDAATGDVLYDKQAHKKRPPASTTKIMTAILGLEMGRPDELVTVSPKAAAVGESTIHLDPGEKITLYELITGALIKSGNDACVAIAEQIAGSEENFLKLMNQKALTLGAKDTHFANTNGLPNKNHYSTAYDLALMARYGLQLPTFSSITRLKETEIHFLEPDVFMDLKNTNKLLWNYPFADGVKTGTTNAAGKCLVASATKDGRQLIAVLLHAPNRFGDAQKLLEWGFEQTENVSFAKAGEVVADFPVANGESVKAFVQYPLEVSVQKQFKEKIEKKVVWTRQPSLPIRAGEELGVYELWLNGQKIKSAPLFAEGEVKKKGGFFKNLE